MDVKGILFCHKTYIFGFHLLETRKHSQCKILQVWFLVSESLIYRFYNKKVICLQLSHNLKMWNLLVITVNLANPFFISATFSSCSFSPFSSFNDEKLRFKYYNKQIATHENGNVQSHGQDE